MLHHDSMKKPSRFQNSSFHREGQVGNVSERPQKPNPAQSAFFTELAETGRPDWKKAPAEVRTRYRGIFMILLSIPFLLLPGWEIYRRVSGRSTKKVQEGEVMDDRSVRKFDEMEKWKVEKSSFMYKLFGKDFYLDGFTSKSMKSDEDSKDP